MKLTDNRYIKHSDTENNIYILAGQINDTEYQYGNEDYLYRDVLTIGSTIVAKFFDNEIEYRRKQDTDWSIMYVIADKYVEWADFLDIIMISSEGYSGLGQLEVELKYHEYRYSEYSDGSWFAENLRVGNHDIIYNIKKDNKGKYCFLVVSKTSDLVELDNILT